MTAQRNTHSPTPSITPDSSPEGFSDAARAEVIGKARERLIEDRGLNNDGVISLSAAQLKKLYALLTNRGAKTTLTIKIFNAVATSEPEKLPLLIDIMSRYNGNVGILDQFLRQLDQQNPFKAANEVQIVVVAPDPKGVVGASGHMLTNTTYWGVDPKVTSHTTGYRSGRMAILKILATRTLNVVRG
jgi:hypothetical protein